ncbi:hypothetical protein [Evtepia sp.]|uniref:hypothetical protein n=1 Tax=Evtepia sp. TaxID=2773933 RepID=UPI003F18520F
MSAFGPPWGDVDRKRPGAPYVVDSDGWGWLFLFIILALPFLFVDSLLRRLSETICAHPYMALIIYSLFSLVIAIAIYVRGRKKQRIFGIIATVLNLMPFSMVTGLYLIPFIMQNSSFSSILEWLIVTVIMGGITILIIVIFSRFSSGATHLLASILFCGIVFYLLNRMLSSSSDINWDVIKALYHWN